MFQQEQHIERHALVALMMDALEEDSRIVWECANGIGVIYFGIIPFAGIIDEQKRIAEQLRQIISSRTGEVEISIGIAEISNDISQIGAHYRQAVWALDVGMKVWPQNKTYHYLELGAFQVLPYIDDSTPRNEFIEITLGKLLRYDNKKNVDFLQTLETLLLSVNLKEAAARLSIHYQTLMFQKRRMEKILGVSLEEPLARMSILTALFLLKLKKQ